MSKAPSVKRGVYRPHERVVFDVGGPSLTRQEFADECEINSIMARYQKTGVIPQADTRRAEYIDFGEFPDFHEAMNMMVAAEEAFMTLPSGVRLRFENDPAEFVRFAQDPENLEDLRKWGLAKPAPAPAPQAAAAPSEAGKAAQGASREPAAPPTQ